MPKIIAASQVVVDDGSGLTIKELVGNVTSKEDRISIAQKKIAKPTSEPWMISECDEWLCILAGRIVIHHTGGELEVVAGQTAFIGRGERYRLVFPG